ncbi:MAG: hypothetical protein KAJ19_01815 [Gammaproteobacteria bacterium]|nr:hypothetical protein [Gammaproteobacteria bacterium]
MRKHSVRTRCSDATKSNELINTTRKEIINTPKNELIRARSVEFAPEKLNIPLRFAWWFKTYSTGNQNTAIKIALKPMCFDILFTRIPYNTKRKIKLRSLSKNEPSAAHVTEPAVMRQYDTARVAPRQTTSTRDPLVARHRKGVRANRDMNQNSGCRWAIDISSADIPAQSAVSKQRILRLFPPSIVSMILLCQLSVGSRRLSLIIVEEIER